MFELARSVQPGLSKIPGASLPAQSSSLDWDEAQRTTEDLGPSPDFTTEKLLLQTASCVSHLYFLNEFISVELKV